MGVMAFLRSLLGGEDQEIPCSEFKTMTTVVEYHARELALWSAINRIGRSFAKCEIKTYTEGKLERGRDYYRLNVAPNRNMNAAAWRQKLVAQLYLNNEALIVPEGEQLLIADSFDKSKFARLDWRFERVKVDGYEFLKPFFMSEVMYLRLNSKPLKKLLDGIGETYARMLAAARNHYERVTGTRGIVYVQGHLGGNADQQSNQSDKIGTRFKALTDKANAVIPLPAGYSYTDLTKGTDPQPKAYGEIRKEIFDMTGQAIGIPPVLLRGEVAGMGEIYDVYLTDCIDPLGELFDKEFARVAYGEKGFLSGNYIKTDTSGLKHTEMLDRFGKVEKAISAGVGTVNEARKLIGMEPSSDKACDRHFITKNYGEIGEA